MQVCLVQPFTTQHNTTQHNTTQHNTTQHNTTQHNTTHKSYLYVEFLERSCLTLGKQDLFVSSDIHTIGKRSLPTMQNSFTYDKKIFTTTAIYYSREGTVFYMTCKALFPVGKTILHDLQSTFPGRENYFA